jgi:capsular polysaccharide biosynthesis protein
MNLHFGLTQSSFTGLTNSEVPFDGEYKILGRYSDSVVVSELSESTNSEIGFYIRGREIYQVNDSICDLITGIAYSSNKKIVKESSVWPHEYLAMTSIPVPIKSAIELISLDTHFLVLPSNGFYHWLIEDLPPFLHAAKLFPSATVLVSEDAPDYVLSALGEVQNRVMFKKRYVSTKDLIFIDKGGNSGWPNPRDIATLRECFEKYLTKGKCGEKIYISRLNATRSPKFEKLLIEMLEEKNWQILDTANLTLPEQISAISSAKILAGVHGAGLANLIWLSANSKIIEISPTRQVNCFRRLAKIADIEHFNYKYETPDFDLDNLVGFLESLD